MITNKKILISGGAGSIGSELVRQLCVDNEVFIFDVDETRTYDLYEELYQKGFKVDYRVGDIRNKETVKEVFKNHFDIIIQAAAYKHVSPMERYPREAVETNILGTLNLLEENRERGLFAFISTDKVVNASSVMGVTKKAAEVIVRASGGICVRFGNVMNSRGSVLEIWKRQFEVGEPLTITDPEMERYMMTIPQACTLVIEAIENGKAGSLWIMDMGEKKNILQLKEELYPGYPHVIIGVREGETLSEELMTDLEKQKAVKQGNFYIL